MPVSHPIVAGWLCLLFALVGWLFLSKSHAIQRWVLQRDKGWNPYRKFMRSRDYVFSLKSFGVASLLVSALMFWVAIRG